MIVRMKEIWLFTLASTVEETVQELGRLGVVDIREINPPEGEPVERRRREVERVESAISILERFSKNDNGHAAGPNDNDNSKDPVRMTDRLLVSADFKRRCLEILDDLARQLEWYKTWGEDMNLRDFKDLRENGIYLRLYRAEEPPPPALAEEHYLVAFPERKGQVPIALFSRDESEKLPYPEEPLPYLTLPEIQQQIIRKERQLAAVELYQEDQARHLAFLREYLRFLQDRLGIQQTLAGMGDMAGQLKYLKGFLPFDTVDALKNKAQQKHWGYQISEPENPEEVPVYIKNPKWVSIINPVMRFIDIVPGYKEVDVSIYFLVAFALFFAMLVGDAGYGAIFLFITFLFRKKMSSQVRLLIYALSGATIIWGVLSGTYFGSETIAALPFFNHLIIPEIASFGVDNISFMMHLSFLIGAIHLSIAHSIRVVQFINSMKALSEIGWIAFVWGLFFVAEKLVLGKALPEWNHWLFVAGAFLVTLFSKEGKTFVGSMLTSVANLPLSLINGFSDIVSYVRLFAVGMATATVAASFNDMILPDGADLSFLGLLVAAVALLLGHGLNIVLALMAVMVHGIRLNMLEFAGHLGVQFSGRAYRPFKLNNGADPGRLRNPAGVETG